MATLLGEGTHRSPTEDYWALFKIWRKTLYNAGIITKKTGLEWEIDIRHLNSESLAKACARSTFRNETRKVLEESLATLRTVFANDPVKMEILDKLAS